MMAGVSFGLAASSPSFSARAASSDLVADFYRNTPVTIVAPADPGDGYDGVARLVARHIGAHIPGHPKVLVQNMGGASGRLAANYAFTRAPHDGSTIIGLLQTAPLGEALKQDGIRYASAEFNWIGSPTTPLDVFVVWKSTGVNTMEDAKKIQISIGSTSATAQNYIYPQLLNELLGTRFNIVTGYAGGNAINLAMERNEIQGRGAFPWDLLKATKADWIKAGRLSFLAETGLHPLRDAPEIPRLVDLSSSPDVKSVFEVMSSTAEVGRPFVMPPGVPQERVDAVVRAFDEMEKDPDFIADAATSQTEVDPRSGKELAALVKSIVEAKPATIARLESALAGDTAKKQSGK